MCLWCCFLVGERETRKTGTVNECAGDINRIQAVDRDDTSPYPY